MSVVPIEARVDGPDEPLPEPGQVVVRDDLAGTYSYGNDFDLGSMFELHADGGYLGYANGHLGPRHASRGAWKVTGDELWVTVDSCGIQDAETDHYEWTPCSSESSFFIVRWGRRVYLVTEEGMDRFVKRVNVGDEPRDHRRGQTIMRQGDEVIAVTGLPTVREAWAGKLLPPTPRGRVLRLVDEGTVVVDLAGQDARVGSRVRLFTTYHTPEERGVVSRISRIDGGDEVFVALDNPTHAARRLKPGWHVKVVAPR